MRTRFLLGFFFRLTSSCGRFRSDVEPIEKMFSEIQQSFLHFISFHFFLLLFYFDVESFMFGGSNYNWFTLLFRFHAAVKKRNKLANITTLCTRAFIQNRNEMIENRKAATQKVKWKIVDNAWTIQNDLKENTCRDKVVSVIQLQERIRKRRQCTYTMKTKLYCKLRWIDSNAIEMVKRCANNDILL